MTTKEKIEVMQAYEDGKQIECRQIIAKAIGDVEWEDSKEPTWDWVMFDYRIKHEPKYRPYKDTAEMIADWKERIGGKHWSVCEMPLIWIWDKCKVEKTLVTGFRRQEINTADAIITMVSLFSSYTYLDGTPCGKEEN